MGWRFTLSDANVVAWLTAPHSQHTTLDLQQAHSLLRDIGHSPISPRNEFLSSSDKWIGNIYHECREYAKRTSYTVNPPVVEAAVKSFSEFFRRINLFALGVVNTQSDYAEMRAFLEYRAYSSKRNGLFLIPTKTHIGDPLSLLAPFPAFTRLAKQPDDWPGVLYWTRTGSCAFCPLRDADDLYSELSKHLEHPEVLDDILNRYAKHQSSSPVILHLSDLHFGATAATDNQLLLLESVQQIINEEGVKRVVITGDLFDNPETKHAQDFRIFLRAVNELCRVDAVIIPGNHDERVWGVGRQKLDVLADLHWLPLVSDDELRINFVCFDSCIDGERANGSITDQRKSAASQLLMALHSRRPETKHYNRMALVHHHPFSFNVPPDSWWRRIVDKDGRREELLLKMVDGKEFAEWCGKSRISLILHGHKHVPYYVKEQVSVINFDGKSEKQVVQTVGCGSSTGKDVGVLSLNLVNWVPSTGDWAVRFLESPPDGSGFVPLQVEVSARTSEEHIA